jgi:hypothetical protein
MKQHLKFVISLFLVSITFSSIYAEDETCTKLFNQGLELKAKKQYADAIKKFQAAGECDEALSAKCSRQIAECRNPAPSKTPAKEQFYVSKKTITIQADGGKDNVIVNNGKNWTATSSESWCKVQKTNNVFSVICDPNETIVERKAIVEVRSGDEFQITEIIQSPALEFLRVSTDQLSISSQGQEDEISVSTNTNWDFSNTPFWVKVTKIDNRLKINSESNNSNGERTGKLVIYTPSGKETNIYLKQSAGNEVLSTSKSIITHGYAGGKEEINVYGNTEDWTIGAYPDWCVVTKKDVKAFTIESLRNSQTEKRTGTIQIKTGKQTVSVKVEQEKGIRETPIAVGPQADLNYHDARVIGGSDISWGITAGLLFPSFATSASSDYLGSAVNYAYNADFEKTDYSSELGFSIGLIADIRLVKNFYLQTGLNYARINVKNKFSGEYTDEFEYSSTTYLKGDAYDKFTEKYSLSYLEIPFTFSYRFKLSDKINWQINAGPYIGYGISGKCEVDGTTDWPSLQEYYYSTDRTTGNSYVQNCKTSGEFDLFGKTGSRKEIYTTGDQPEYDYEYDFDDSPFSKLNIGFSLGTAIEFGGFNIGVSYDMGLNNIANEDYWKSTRYTISDYNGSERIEDYKHKINRFQLKIGYIFRW